MLEWVIAHPQLTTFGLSGIAGGLIVLLRFGLSRHREYVVFIEHMKKEENDIWPQTTEAVSQLEEKITGFHEEMLEKVGDLGQRVARVEARMPNGELGEIKAMLQQLVRKSSA